MAASNHRRRTRAPLLLTTLATLTVPATPLSSSTLFGTQWKVKLNVGLERGSYMSTTEWGKSGGRLIVDATVDFSFEPYDEAEDLVGPPEKTMKLGVVSGGKIVTLEGEKEVVFKPFGGWCVQRAIGQPKESEGALRFWLDCESGASRGDVTVDAGERLFFTTSVWDDAEELVRLTEFKKKTEEELAKFQRQKEEKELQKQQQQQQQAETSSSKGGSGEKMGEVDRFVNMVPGLKQLFDFQKAVKSEEVRTRLESRARVFSRVPNLGSGVPAAIETGGISVKRKSQQGFQRKNAYHILGTFDMEPEPEPAAAAAAAPEP